MKKSIFPVIILIISVFVSSALMADSANVSEDLTRQHLAAVHAKWGVIKVILDEIYNPEFKGSDASRAAISYVCRHVTCIAAPALNRWVIRPEKKYLGSQLEKELDVKVHQFLEGFDMSIGFCNSPDKELWNEVARKMHDRIKEGRKNAAAIFKRIPNPEVKMDQELQKQVVNDEIRIITAFLVNQDENHRWTPVKDGTPSFRDEEIKRVAVLHSQVLHITAKMIEYVLCNTSAVSRESQRELAEVNKMLMYEKELSMRVISKGKFDWEVMHNQFHKVFDKAYSQLEKIRFAEEDRINRQVAMQRQ